MNQVNESQLIDVTSKRHEIEDAYKAVAQSRSDFQLANFVVGQHDTVTRAFSQTIIELRVKSNNIRKAQIDVQIIQERIKRAIQSGDDIELLEAEKLKIELEDLEFNILSDVREFNCLYAIFKSLPPLTYDQIQKGEAEYWCLRISRQAQQDIEANGRVGVGNLDALRTIGMLDNPAKLFLDNMKKPELENK